MRFSILEKFQKHGVDVQLRCVNEVYETVVFEAGLLKYSKQFQELEAAQREFASWRLAARSDQAWNWGLFMDLVDKSFQSQDTEK